MFFYLCMILNFSFLICSAVQEIPEENHFFGKSIEDRLFLKPQSVKDYFDTGYPMTYEKFDEILKKNNINKIIFNLTVPRSGTWFFQSIMKQLPGLDNFNPNLVQLLKFEEFYDEYRDSNFDFCKYFDLLLRNRFNNGIFILGGHFEASKLFLQTLFNPECLNDERWYVVYLYRQNTLMRDLSMLNSRKHGIWHNWGSTATRVESLGTEDLSYNSRSEISEDQYKDFDTKLHLDVLNEIFHNFEKVSTLAIFYEVLVSETFCIIKMILEDVRYTVVDNSEIESAIQKSLPRNRVEGKNLQIAQLLGEENKRNVLKSMFHYLVRAQQKFEDDALPISCSGSFQISLNNTNYLSGFSGQEEWGRWIDKSKAILMIDSEILNTPKAKSIEFSLRGYVPLPDSVVSFNLVVNSINMGEYKFNSTKSECHLFVTVPSNFTNELIMRFVIEGLASPSELGHSEDSRTLGIAVDKNIKISNLEEDIRGISARFTSNNLEFF